MRKAVILALVLGGVGACSHVEPKSPCVCDWQAINEQEAVS